jgi:hypothetical protein
VISRENGPDLPDDVDAMPVDIKTVGSADLPPEPAEHDDPEGPTRGWSSADFGPEDYVGDNGIIELTEPVADGRQVTEELGVIEDGVE